jgi:type IV secretory pathway VirD2 relaxase
MASRDDDRFRPKVGSPRAKDGPPARRFISRVVKVATEAGGGRRGRQLGRASRTSQLHRGVVAARALRQLGARGRRVLIKSRLVNLRKIGLRSTQVHLRYLERDGVTKDGTRAHAYNGEHDVEDVAAFEQRGRDDRHQFRFIVSPEDANELEDLRGFTRDLMARVEKDLGTRLDWVAVDHWNTDNPHTHIVLRGKDDQGRDLVIAREYISRGMRARASELATEWLGPRTEREIQEALLREVRQERWTSLDIAIRQRATDGVVDLRPSPTRSADEFRRQLLVGRVQALRGLGLATESQPGVWVIADRSEQILRAAGERGDIIRTMQRAMRGMARPIEIADANQLAKPIVGRVMDKGLADELTERNYVVIDGIDGRARYVPLPTASGMNEFPIGAIVEIRAAAVRTADREILAHARDGIYDPARHREALTRQGRSVEDAHEFVTAHVRRLEALRRAGVVERQPAGVWQVPENLPELGRGYDAKRLAGAEVRLLSHLPIEKQTRVIGATWLDRELTGDPSQIPDAGFGSEVRAAIRTRLAFLVDKGLAARRGDRVVLTGDLLGTLRQRELAQAADLLQKQSGLAYQPVVDGQRVSGVYRRSVQLASGRFAMLETNGGFALVPWRSIIERKLGQEVSGLVRNGGVSWDLSRRRGLGI